MSKDKMSYAEAIAEIEEILERLDSGKLDVDTLATNVKRATELIAECKGKLRKAEDEITSILSDE